MMFHRVLFFLIFFCGSVQAQAFIDAVIIQNDGTEIKCVARLPVMSEKNIRFKTDIKGKSQKMNSKDIKTVCYYRRGEKFLEIEYLRYISFIETSNSRLNVFATEWIEVVVRGPLMLYVISEVSRTGQRKTIVYHYFVKRENEEFATEIAYVRYKNDFLIYRMEAGDYFVNTPDLEKKIENREEGYTAKDIVNIVNEYNTLQETNSKP